MRDESELVTTKNYNETERTRNNSEGSYSVTLSILTQTPHICHQVSLLQKVSILGGSPSSSSFSLSLSLSVLHGKQGHCLSSLVSAFSVYNQVPLGVNLDHVLCSRCLFPLLTLLSTFSLLLVLSIRWKAIYMNVYQLIFATSIYSFSYIYFCDAVFDCTQRWFVGVLILLISFFCGP